MTFNPAIHARLNIVLIEPEIPQNTGTIGRLCLGMGAHLHLVKPLGFSLDEHALKRAGLDYWEHLNVTIHENVESYFQSLAPDNPKVLVETRAGRTLYEARIEPGTHLIFGRETSGLADWILTKYAADVVRIPMWDARIRSLNLSNAVSICAYEAVRQIQSNFIST
jgi:tRNA (cytidine/uridine-2'-O-)-methyltransferase